MARITCPWPPKQLFPNYKRAHHWTRYHKQAKSARTLGWGLTAQEIGPQLRKYPVDETLEIRLSFTPPMRAGRPADEDGVKGACKHYLDGISDALGVDDAKFRFAPVVWNPKQDAGSVVIEF